METGAQVDTGSLLHALLMLRPFSVPNGQMEGHGELLRCSDCPVRGIEEEVEDEDEGARLVT